jgi:hypothetical protein
MRDARSTWGFEPDEPRGQTMLLHRNLLRFEAVPPFREGQLDHAIIDHSGVDVGHAHQEPTSRGETRIGINDASGRKVLELRRRRWPPRQPVEVINGEGALVGWIAKVKRRRFEYVNALGERTGAISRRARLWGVDFVVLDTHGRQIGRIADAARLDFEAEPLGARNRFSRLMKRVTLTAEPSRHVLLIDDDPDADLRRMMLASAAAVYLFLQKPFTGGE